MVLTGAARVPPEISLTVGDALNALRSALDNLVWQLGLTESAQPHERLAWPVAREGGPGVADNDQRLRGLPDGAARLVRAMQAAEDGKWTPLVHLDRLWNDDKHRRLHLLTGYVTSPAGLVVHPPADSPGLFAARYAQTARVGLSEPGDLLLRIPLGYEAASTGSSRSRSGRARWPAGPSLRRLRTFTTSSPRRCSRPSGPSCPGCERRAAFVGQAAPNRS